MGGYLCKQGHQHGNVHDANICDHNVETIRNAATRGKRSE